MKHGFRIEINARTPSLNQLLGQHWAKREREKHQWGMMIKACVNNRSEISSGAPYKNIKIIMTRKRLLDVDNAIGGTKKVITDNLKLLGLIEGDDIKSVNIEYEQVKGEDKTVVWMY